MNVITAKPGENPFYDLMFFSNINDNSVLEEINIFNAVATIELDDSQFRAFKALEKIFNNQQQGSN